MTKIMKNRLIFFLLLFFGTLFSGRLLAQVPVERSTEIEKVGGKEYYMHRVKSSETLYSIAKAYQVTVESIEDLNPEVKNGLKAGYVIGIRVVEPEKPAAVEENHEAQNVVVPIKPQVSAEGKLGGFYVVQSGEDLYDIAKKFGIDVADFKAINPGLTNEPEAGTTIKVPEIVNTDDYIVHKVEYSERTTALLKRWKVSESDFREKNISVGSHVFENQVVLIPIDPVSIAVNQVAVDDESETEPSVDEVQDELVIEEDFEAVECDVLPENASQCYKVALMIPLYLYDMGKLDVGKEGVAKARKSRSLAFLQYYEGFMMAVDALTKNEGLNLDLTVIDVTESVASAQDAIAQIQGQDIDLIVGPFFNKSFVEVEAYAKANGIKVVNPLSTREDILDDNPNVIKVKPSAMGQIYMVSNLVKNQYYDSNVFIISNENKSDTAFMGQLERHLNRAVHEAVTLSNDEILNYARTESQRMEMGERLVPTVNVEGQVYSTDELQEGKDEVVIDNFVKRYDYATDGLRSIKQQLSGIRNNLIIAYGDSNVFATQILNSLKKEADRYPITLVALPDWTKFEKLLVENLLQMNAVYLSDCFVDYSNVDVKHFVRQFRAKYDCEPQDYAFEGYDLANYFLTALMRYGSDFMDCLPYFELPLMHTRYHFVNRHRNNNEKVYGMENVYWSVFQYDNDDIELIPINPFEKRAEE